MLVWFFVKIGSSSKYVAFILSHLKRTIKIYNFQALKARKITEMQKCSLKWSFHPAWKRNKGCRRNNSIPFPCNKREEKSSNETQPTLENTLATRWYSRYCMIQMYGPKLNQGHHCGVHLIWRCLCIHSWRLTSLEVRP